MNGFCLTPQEYSSRSSDGGRGPAAQLAASSSESDGDDGPDLWEHIQARARGGTTEVPDRGMPAWFRQQLGDAQTRNAF